MSRAIEHAATPATPAMQATMAQWRKVRGESVTVVLDGKTARIWGHAVNIVPAPLDGPEVVLLSDDSTPQKWEVGAGAEEEFIAAARGLVYERVEFYTFLRHGWAWPALRWTLNIGTE